MTVTPAALGVVLESLERDGFHIVENAWPEPDIETIRASLSGLMDDTPFGENSFVGTRTKRRHSVFGQTRVLDGLAIDPLVLAAVQAHLGDALLSATVACEIHPGETAQAIHTDDGIYPLPVDHPDVSLSALWALDDFTSTNGGTIVYPASHRDRGTRPDPADGRIIEMPAGSVLIYSGTLWHGGGANVGDDPRLALILTYVQSWLRPQDTHLISVPVKMARTLHPDLRALLGYSMRPPFLGYVDGHDPRQLFAPESSAS